MSPAQHGDALDAADRLAGVVGDILRVLLASEEASQ